MTEQDFHRVEISLKEGDSHEPHRWIHKRCITEGLNWDQYKHIWKWGLTFDDGGYHVGYHYLIKDPDIAIEFKLIFGGK